MELYFPWRYYQHFEEQVQWRGCHLLSTWTRSWNGFLISRLFHSLYRWKHSCSPILRPVVNSVPKRRFYPDPLFWSCSSSYPVVVFTVTMTRGLYRMLSAGPAEVTLVFFWRGCGYVLVNRCNIQRPALTFTWMFVPRYSLAVSCDVHGVFTNTLLPASLAFKYAGLPFKYLNPFNS